MRGYFYLIQPALLGKSQLIKPALVLVGLLIVVFHLCRARWFILPSTR